ncbi:MAG: AmmeMemoRadiSam system radical SAM enzyme, partial [Candidatus Omnitrophota bacterium]
LCYTIRMVKNTQPYLARWWSKHSDDTVQCSLCPRCCLIKKGDRGFCFVRQNINGELVSVSYGWTSGSCVDPIEKKPLYHFYPGAHVFSFGTVGCNLGCKFCQNWPISKVEDLDRLVEKASPRDIANIARNAQCDLVAFTYNEPVISAEYVIDTAKECQALGLRTIVVTDGY